MCQTQNLIYIIHVNSAAHTNYSTRTVFSGQRLLIKILPNMFRIFFSLLVYHLTIFDPLKLVCTIFYQIFIFDQVIALQKLWKMFFISSKKLFFSSKYSIFCKCFPSFPHFPDSKGQMEVEYLWCHKLPCINLQI